MTIDEWLQASLGIVAALAVGGGVALLVWSVDVWRKQSVQGRKRREHLADEMEEAMQRRREDREAAAAADRKVEEYERLCRERDRYLVELRMKVQADMMEEITTMLRRINGAADTEKEQS